MAILGALLCKYRYLLPRTAFEQRGSSIHIFPLNEWAILFRTHLICLIYSYLPNILLTLFFFSQLLLWQPSTCRCHLTIPALSCSSYILSFFPRGFFAAALWGTYHFSTLCKPERVRKLTLKVNFWPLGAGRSE